MRKLLTLMILAGALLVTSACATITRGTTDTLVIESEPPNAIASISPVNLQCKTPCSIKLPRNQTAIVTIEKDNYESVTVNVTPQISGGGGAGMAGNIIFGGIIGAGVDAGSGAMNDLKPNPIQVKLEKKEASPAATQTTTADRLKELDDLKKKGLISGDEYAKKKEAILKAI